MSRLFLFLLCCPYILYAQSADSTRASRDTVRIYTVPSITVTTTRAVRQQSPVPFSELNRAEIKQTYTYQDMPALLSNLPSTLFYSENGNNVGYSYLSMRGFDQRRIAVMVNGIPQNDPEDHNVYWIDLPDLAASAENIQVQRGAGFINYGAAALGGSINLATSNFANQRAISVSSGFGYQEFGGTDAGVQPNISKYSLDLSSGMVGNYAFYGRLSRIHSRGYRDNSWVTLNSYFLSGVRYDDQLTTQINVFGGPLSDGLAYTGLPKSYIKDVNLRRTNFNYWEYNETGDTIGFSVYRRPQETEQFSQPHYELLNDWYITDSLTLKSSLFYYTGEGYFDFDGAWASYDPAGVFRLTPQYGFDSGAAPQNAIIRAFVGNQQGGWLPRLIWNHGTGTLTVGAEARLHRSEHWGKIAFAENLSAGYDPDYKFYSYNGERDIFSAFGREQYRLSDQLLLNVEAQTVYHAFRITNEKAGNLFTTYQTTQGSSVGNGGDLFNVTYFFVNPRLGLTARLNETTSFYGSLAYTSHEPRMKNLYSAEESYTGAQPLFATDTTGGIVRYDFTKPTVHPEKMLDIEVGGDYRTPDFSISLNGYFMDFSDELVKSGQRDIFGNPVDGNAPKTRHLGMELEGSVLLMRSGTGALQLSGNATISSNHIISFLYAEQDGTVTDLKNNPIAGFPDFLGNLRISYQQGGLSGGLAGKYVGAFYTDNFKDEKNKNNAYIVLNADLSYEFKDILSLQRLRLQAQINNLLNRLYSASGNGVEFFPAAERNVFVGIELGI